MGCQFQAAIPGPRGHEAVGQPPHGHCQVEGAGGKVANPKSSSFAPALVSMMLPGFRSRWMIPYRCALSKVSAISIATVNA